MLIMDKETKFLFKTLGIAITLSFIGFQIFNYKFDFPLIGYIIVMITHVILSFILAILIVERLDKRQSIGSVSEK